MTRIVDFVQVQEAVMADSMPTLGTISEDSSFVGKLAMMLQDPVAQSFASWSSSGDSIVVFDHKKFASQILPRYFKHSNMSSFIRQLNLYGFHKITPKFPDFSEFSHPIFRKGNEQNFKDIRRNVAQLVTVPANQQRNNFDESRTANSPVEAASPAPSVRTSYLPERKGRGQKRGRPDTSPVTLAPSSSSLAHLPDSHLREASPCRHPAAASSSATGGSSRAAGDDGDAKANLSGEGKGVESERRREAELVFGLAAVAGGSGGGEEEDSEAGEEKEEGLRRGCLGNKKRQPNQKNKFAFVHYGLPVVFEMFDHLTAKTIESSADDSGLRYVVLTLDKKQRASQVRSAIDAWNMRQRDPASRVRLSRLPHEEDIVTFTKARGHQDHAIYRRIADGRARREMGQVSAYAFWSRNPAAAPPAPMLPRPAPRPAPAQSFSPPLPARAVAAAAPLPSSRPRCEASTRAPALADPTASASRRRRRTSSAESEEETSTVAAAAAAGLVVVMGDGGGGCGGGGWGGSLMTLAHVAAADCLSC